MDEINVEVEELYHQAITLMDERRDQDAEKILLKALEIEPHHFMALRSLGFILKGLDDDNRAIEVFERALAIHQRDTSILNALGMLYARIGKDEKAIDYFRASAFLGNAYAFYLLGNCYRRLGNYSEAERYLRWWHEQHPTESVAMNDLADALFKQGKEDEAISLWKTSSEQYPKAKGVKEAREMLKKHQKKFFGLF